MADNSSRQLVKWTGIVAVLTALSKIVGFGRESAIAYVYGTGMEADAFYMVMAILAILFVIFHQSIINAFIPVYGGLRKREDGLKFVNTFILGLTALLVVMALLIAYFAPQVAAIMTNFSGEKLRLTGELLRIMVPAIIFMGLSGATTGFLHAHHSFLAPTLVGFPYNFVIILGALLFGSTYGIQGLAVATVIGYATQLLIQLPWAVKKDFSLRAGMDWHHKGLQELRVILPPILVAGGAGEIKSLIDKMFATMLDRGVSSLNYAARIRALPLGLLILPMVTVFYPTLVDLAEEQDYHRFKTTLSQGLGVIIFLTLPITAGLIALGTPIVRLLFERGAFAAESTAITAFALVFYSMGLTFEAMRHLLTRSFFAIKDSRIPMVITIIVSVLDVILNYLLIGPMGVGGLALATSICFLVGAVLSLYFLRRKIGPMNGRVLVSGGGKALLAAAVMGAVVYYASLWWQGIWLPSSFPGQALQVGLLIALGAGLYFLMAWVMKIESMQLALQLAGKLWHRLRREDRLPDRLK